MPPDKEHEIILIIIVCIILFIVLSGLLIFILHFSQRTKFKTREKLLKVEKQYKEEILKARLETQEQTLQHISDELHDNLGQVASLIKINLYTIPLNDINKATQKVEEIKELTRQLITDMKSLSVSLGTDRILKSGLAKAIETEIERINKTGQFTATFLQEGNLSDLNYDTEIILYRMTQEVLNNMVKHSNAQHIILKLSFIENLTILAISDDGKGFDVSDKIKNADGAGLSNLYKRAALINANLTIQSSIGNGTKIIIELPYNYAPNTAGNFSIGR